MYAFSRLALLASFRAPSRAALKAERHWQQVVTVGPYNAFPRSFLWCAEALGFPMEMRPLSLTSFSAAFRTVVRGAPEVGQYLGVLRSVAWDDKAIINCGHRAWVRTLLHASNLAQAVVGARALGCTPKLVEEL